MQDASRSGPKRFGSFELDLRAGELRKQGVKIKLQERPLQILTMLLASPGHVVLREELRSRLWPGDTFVDFDHGLNRAINKLREVLGDFAENPRFVETLPRRGYRFLVSSNGTPEALPKFDDPRLTPSPYSRLRHLVAQADSSLDFMEARIITKPIELRPYLHVDEHRIAIITGLLQGLDGELGLAKTFVNQS